MPNHSRRRAEIATWLALREREGLTYAELSERCGLAASTLSWWSWRFRREGSSHSRGFTELEVVEDDPSSRVVSESLRLRIDDVVVEVPRDFDAEHLGRVLDVLGARC